jgi:hypothetical protein
MSFFVQVSRFQDETNNSLYNKDMPNVFRRAVSGKTLRHELSGTVFKAGTKRRFSEKSFQKQLQKSSSPLLRRKLGFNKGIGIKKHQALQTAEAFYREAAEKKEAYNMDEYSLRKKGITVNKESGKITKIGSERMYQAMAKEEQAAEADNTKGPSKEQLEKEANRKRAQAQMSKWRRIREDALKEKQNALQGVSGQKTGPQGLQGPAGSGHPQAQATQPKNLHIPTMAHGSIGKTTSIRDSSVQSLDENMQIPPDEATVNPLISRLKEESGLIQPQSENAAEGVISPSVDPNVPAQESDTNTETDTTEEAPDEEIKKAA